MAGNDIPLKSTSSHRLPTVSASQAFISLHAENARTISTGLSQLDSLLTPPSLPGYKIPGGYVRGKVTEIFGPPGSGKTALGIQAAVSALRQSQHVVWIDAGCPPLVRNRFADVCSDLDETLDYIAVPTLAHLLALFVHTPTSFPRKHTAIVVIDSISTLIDNAYPRNADSAAKNRTDQSKWAAGRRFTVMGELMVAFTKFAVLQDVVLLLTCQTITRIRGSSRAVLVPAVSGAEWENGISTRIVLFRDWLRQDLADDTVDADTRRKVRLAGLVKANGVTYATEGEVGNVVAFVIGKCAIGDIALAASSISTPIVFAKQDKPLKRPFSEIDEKAEEVPDSDELYGWIEDDEVAAEGLLIDEAPLTGAASKLPIRSDDAG